MSDMCVDSIAQSTVNYGQKGFLVSKETVVLRLRQSETKIVLSNELIKVEFSNSTFIKSFDKT